MTDDTKVEAAENQRKPRPKQSRKASKSDAKHLLGKLTAERELQKLEEEQVLNDSHTWYVRCNICNEPALFLKARVLDGFIKPDNWFSTYKELDQPYYSSNIPCQSCYQNISSVTTGRDGTFQIPPRYIASPETRDELKVKADRERARNRAMAIAKVTVMDGEDVS